VTFLDSISWQIFLASALPLLKLVQSVTPRLSSPFCHSTDLESIIYFLINLSLAPVNIGDEELDHNAVLIRFLSLDYMRFVITLPYAKRQRRRTALTLELGPDGYSRHWPRLEESSPYFRNRLKTKINERRHDAC
jgi:hypothetical protein